MNSRAGRAAGSRQAHLAPPARAAWRRRRRKAGLEHRHVGFVVARGGLLRRASQRRQSACTGQACRALLVAGVTRGPAPRRGRRRSTAGIQRPSSRCDRLRIRARLVSRLNSVPSPASRSPVSGRLHVEKKEPDRCSVEVGEGPGRTFSQHLPPNTPLSHRIPAEAGRHAGRRRGGHSRPDEEDVIFQSSIRRGLGRERLAEWSGLNAGSRPRSGSRRGSFSRASDVASDIPDESLPVDDARDSIISRHLVIVSSSGSRGNPGPVPLRMRSGFRNRLPSSPPIRARKSSSLKPCFSDSPWQRVAQRERRSSEAVGRG